MGSYDRFNLLNGSRNEKDLGGDFYLETKFTNWGVGPVEWVKVGRFPTLPMLVNYVKKSFYKDSSREDLRCIYKGKIIPIFW